jgi:hypothetical protein
VTQKLHELFSKAYTQSKHPSLGAIPCSIGTYVTRTLITLGCRNPRENLNLAMRLFVKLHYSLNVTLT